MMQAKEYQDATAAAASFRSGSAGIKEHNQPGITVGSDGRWPCTLHGVLFSEDSRAFLRCLQQLGFLLHIDEPEKRVTIQGTRWKHTEPYCDHPCGKRWHSSPISHGIPCICRRRLSSAGIGADVQTSYGAINYGTSPGRGNDSLYRRGKSFSV